MSSKLTTILDALPSDPYTVGGEGWNQLIKILKNINVESEEDLTINTKIKWQSGKLVLVDAGAPFSHEVSIEVENIVVGDPRHLILRAFVNTTDYFVTELEAQVLLKKTFGSAAADSEARFGKTPNFQGFGLDHVGIIKIRDLGTRNVSLVELSNTNPNTFFEILSGYNTANHAAISTATDIRVRFGFGSEIDTYQIYSQADGVNTKILEIKKTLLDINSTTVDFHNAVINNILLAKSQIPSTVVHTDQANLFGSFTQDFPSGWARIKAGSTFVSLGSNTQTGSFSFIIPALTTNDSPAMLALPNIFTTFQKIQYVATAALTLYRPDNTVGNGTGVGFNLRNSANAETQFAAIYAVNNQNTAGSELGSLVFYIRNGATIVDRLVLSSDNKLGIGLTGQRIVWDPTGISGTSKNFTMPNLSGEVQTLNAVQTQLNKTIDIRTNTLLRMARIGRYHCSSNSGVDGEGILGSLVSVGDQGTTTENTGGKYHVWTTKAVINDCAGVVDLSGFVVWRLTNPLVRFAFLFVTGANRRMFKGWTAQRLLSVDSDTAPLLNTEHGFVFGYGIGDTQFQIWHNDGTGACVKETTGINIPGVGTNYILEISNSGATYTWALYNVDGTTQARSTLVGSGTINTRVPGSTTNLFLQDLIATSTAVITANNIHYIEVYN